MPFLKGGDKVAKSAAVVDSRAIFGDGLYHGYLAAQIRDAIKIVRDPTQKKSGTPVDLLDDHADGKGPGGRLPAGARSFFPITCRVFP